jgi:hypothetical protein
MKHIALKNIASKPIASYLIASQQTASEFVGRMSYGFKTFYCLFVWRAGVCWTPLCLCCPFFVFLRDVWIRTQSAAEAGSFQNLPPVLRIHDI